MPPDCTGEAPRGPADVTMDEEEKDEADEDISDTEGMDIHETSSKVKTSSSLFLFTLPLSTLTLLTHCLLLFLLLFHCFLILSIDLKIIVFR